MIIYIYGGICMKKGMKVLLIVLCLIFAGVFAFSGYKLLSKWHEYKVAEKTYDSISSQYVSTQSNDGKETEENTPEEQQAPEKEIDPEHSPITVDFNALKAQCGDIQAWIYLPDTVINYPVVQCDDNMYYLHRLIDGNYNSSGSLFIECLCPKNFQADNTIIYGHHMNDGSMFARLVYYNTQEFYEQHPNFYINTLEGKNYRCEIFAGYVTSSTSDTYQISFSSDQAFSDYINSMKSQSLFKSQVEVQPGDKIVTLSTCTYDYDDARFVVQAKLVEIH